MAQLTRCERVTHLYGRPGFLFAFESHEPTMEEMKRRIFRLSLSKNYFGQYNWRWRPDTKDWWVAEEYTGVLKDLFPNFEALIHQQQRLPL